MAFDYKKEYKEFYLPKGKPEIVQVPPMNYIAVRGSGNPNELGGSYQQAMQILYAIAYTLKMSHKTDYKMEGFFEYVVPPLEGFWWQEDVAGVDYSRKEDFRWISLIRLPDFVTERDFQRAAETATKKKAYLQSRSNQASPGCRPLKKTEKIIFPRYHQLDVVRELVRHVRENGPGHNYLIQHSAGSGKSNSIAWTAYRMASLHDSNNEAVYDSVIVVTDRRVLDQQLQATVSSFDHTLGSVETIDDKKSSKDLLNAINKGKRVIVTTLQKFPVIYEQVQSAVGKHYAIIVDEARSSQTGQSAMKLKAALADVSDALEEYAELEQKAVDEIEAKDILVQDMLSQGKHKNLSFFAFTATPKGKTLEIFGEPQPDGSFHPFHIYSMRQAKELHKEYILCSYLAKLLPSDKTQPFGLDNRVKLEYYRLEKTYEGAIELETTPGFWKPTQPDRARGQKDRLSPLDEIIARINEEFFGDFTDADRVMVDTLYTKMRQDAKVKKAAKSNDRQVYERSIFPGIFDTTAQQAYMENTDAYEQLFLDAEKYRIIQQALAEQLYRELHGDSE